MFTKRYISHAILLTILATFACGQYARNLTPRQRDRIRPIYSADPSNLTTVDAKSRNLFKIIHGRIENRGLEVDSCEVPTLEMPNFRQPGLRLSDVKCLEHLWKIRYYDEALISAALCTNSTRSKAVYTLVTAVAGGLDGVAGPFPHMGAIGWETVNDTWLFICEGALVSDKFMVTAAHCSRLPTPDPRVSDLSPKVARLGVINISDEEEIGKSPKDVLIHRFIIHPQYKYSKNYYDIAIIEFEEKLTLTSKLYPACLWTNLFELTGTAELTAWSTIESNKTVVSKEFISDSYDVFTRITLLGKMSNTVKDQNTTTPILQVANVNMMSESKCDKLIPKNLLFHQLCAERVPANITSCQDTGGVLGAQLNIPEFTDWKMHYLLGVRSFSYGCDNESQRSFGVYTKVSVFLDWIEGIVWGKEPK